MKNYYNLDTIQAEHFAGLHSGESMVFVVPFKKQPVDHKLCSGCRITRDDALTNINAVCNHDGRITYELPYPVGARVGLRETWRYKGIYDQLRGEIEGNIIYKSGGRDDALHGWHSSQCMPHEAIRYWPPVIDVRICQVQSITHEEIVQHRVVASYLYQDLDMLFRRFEHWFNTRYARTNPKHTWESNPWGEVVTVKKE